MLGSARLACLDKITYYNQYYLYRQAFIHKFIKLF